MEVKQYNQEKIITIYNKKIKCPNCKKKSKPPYIPFCSKKCSDLDLLKWLAEESYINFDI